MTLTGQETRIQIRYLIPGHHEIPLYEQLCERYMQQSKEQLQKTQDEYHKLREKKLVEKTLDQEFAKKLAEMERDSVDEALPVKKKK